MSDNPPVTPLEYGQRYGYVRQSDQGRCVAIWIPPGKPMSPGRMVRCGMLAVPLQTGLGPLVRFGCANGVVDKINKRHMSELGHVESGSPQPDD